MRSPQTHSVRPVDHKESDQTDALSLGVEIRKLRKARGKSLAAVALSIGRSVSFISQIERGQAQAAIADLKGIARLLGVPVGWFFLADTVPTDERGRVVRGLERRRLGNSAQGLREELLSPDIGGSFETFLSTFEPGAAMTQATKRDTEEEGYVVRGSLDLWVGKKLFHLNPGDSFRIVREPFRWRNPTQAETVVVWVIAPPEY